MLIIVTILINVLAIAIWSVIAGQNGFAEAAKMLRGEPAFIRSTPSGGKVISKDLEAAEAARQAEEDKRTGSGGYGGRAGPGGAYGRD